MKVIDLLNKIANGEAIPKKIKLDNIIFIFQDGEYISNNGDGSCLDQFMCFYYRDLNKEVEIIEEDKKINNLIYYNKKDFDNLDEFVEITTRDIFDKINEIIDKLNEMEK